MKIRQTVKYKFFKNFSFFKMLDLKVGDKNWDLGLIFLERWIRYFQSFDPVLGQQIINWYLKQADEYFQDLEKNMFSDDASNKRSLINTPKYSKAAYNEDNLRLISMYKNYYGDNPDIKYLEEVIMRNKSRADKWGDVFYKFLEQHAQKTTKLEDLLEENFPLNTNDSDEDNFKLNMLSVFLYSDAPMSVYFFRENWDRYKQQFENYKQILTKSFIQTGKIQQNRIIDLFYYINCLSCLDLVIQVIPDNVNTDYLLSMLKNIPNVFFLVNRTGYFGYNTFLQAYFNDIFLVGVPMGNSSFHGTYTCPNPFIQHDILHYVSYSIIPKSVQQTYKDAWFFTKNLDLSFRRFFTLYLFILVNEISLTDLNLSPISNVIASKNLEDLEPAMDSCRDFTETYDHFLADFLINPRSVDPINQERLLDYKEFLKKKNNSFKLKLARFILLGFILLNYIIHEKILRPDGTIL